MKKIIVRKAGFVSLGSLSLIIAALGLSQLTNDPSPDNKNDQEQATAEISDDMMSAIYQDIEQREYHISYDAKQGKYQSPNRTQNIRAYYESGKWFMQNRVDSMGINWNLMLATAGVYADGSRYAQVTDEPQVNVEENQIEFVHEVFTEQYINDKNGVRQNFIIHEAPEKTQEIAVRLDIAGMEPKLVGKGEILFVDGAHQLSYSGLKAWDAKGKLLEATLELGVEPARLWLRVMADQVTFPVTIDPIVVHGNPDHADAFLESDQVNAYFGFSVSGAGDVDGDGYDDVIVGAYQYDNGENNEGVAFVYRGSENGILMTPSAILESNQAVAYFGTSVSGAGDVNSDGYDDVIVGANGYDNGESNEGVAFVYRGSENGILTTPSVLLESNQVSALFGRSVSAAGDVNGDGYDDVIVGAYYYDNGENNEGAAFVYRGSENGILTTPSVLLESNQVSALFGRSVSAAGDVNDDGYDDVIVGAYYYDNGESNEGAAFVYLGSENGILTTPSAILESNQADSSFGTSVSAAGDVNSDGYDDVIVGAYNYDNGEHNEGAAFVYHGSENSILMTPSARLECNQDNASFGRSVSAAGDVDGDGYDDVIVGAYQYDNGETDEGAAFVYQGSENGILKTPSALLESNQASAAFGVSVSGAGDVNSDGYDDIIVGAQFYENGETNEGAAFVYHGAPNEVGIVASDIISSNQTNANMGISVSGAGDVNGDGYSDVIIGADFYDHGENNEGAAFVYHGAVDGVSISASSLLESNQTDAGFGKSVSGAGDVNGDGYGDVIIGAPTFDNGENNEGASFIHHGSESGVSSVASTVLECNQQGAQFGFSVSGAGDVNGDGYSDVIVGARQYDNEQNNEGAAFIYHGSMSGVSSVAALLLESNQAQAQMGRSVSGAGDVNGDGYSDVIVGVSHYDNVGENEGAAFIYHGSSEGVSSTIFATLESNQADARLGFSVSGAGDVNGDGYSDVIVGSRTFDNGENDEGAAFVYHGSSGGVSSSTFTILESNQVDAQFAVSVSGAGDVNGDGYADVIVGATLNGRGAAYIYQGSSDGVSMSSPDTLKSIQPLGNFAGAVSGAGDVNGDGYSDVIVGAPLYDVDKIDEGAAFIYHGAADGLSDLPSLIVGSDQANAQLGLSVSGAGDINGDGFDDVIVGAHLYDNGQNNEGAAFIYHGSISGLSSTANTILESNQGGARLGRRVSAAGDVNGDGYGDIIVGVPQYNNAHTNAGAAYLYHGSVSGITNVATTVIEGDQENGRLGFSVSDAGDVNGDGFDDVIVGAHLYDNGESNEGQVYVYNGSSDGINTTASTTIEGNQDNSRLGYSISGAGDVNGDGYSDVILGAPLHDNGETNEGVAYLYHGSDDGLNTVAITTLESNQIDAFLGWSVSGAGDVNGDGFGDVIVGAYGYDQGEIDEGVAFVYHGSAGGLLPTPVIVLERNQTSAEFGNAVGAAGDVNGDGYSDVIVGAPLYDDGEIDEGAVFLYSGSPSGLSSEAATKLESDQTGANFGSSLDGIGDVNGDHYSDVIIGSNGYDDGETDEGAFFIYSGNNGSAMRNNIQLYNTSTTIPLSQSNFSEPDFSVGVFARSPQGRTRAKLVWETQSEGQPFSGNPITNAVYYSGEQDTYVDLATAGTQLTTVIPKSGHQTKVRVRVKYDPVSSLDGQLYGPWIYPQEYFGAQGMSGISLPIELTYFKVHRHGTAAVITWQTASEINNDYFTIERSGDGVEFEEIFSLNGAGNSSEVHTYREVDSSPLPGTSYYKLKQTDFDGQFSYANVVTFRDYLPESTELDIYPNPAISEVSIKGVAPDTIVEIFNINGSSEVNRVTLSQTDKVVIMNLSQLLPGMYFIKSGNKIARLVKR